MTLQISNRSISKNNPPFIIAELSGNHNQSLQRALAMVEAAAAAGVDAIKLQTYTANTMTLPLNYGDFIITEKESLWYGKSLYDLYEIAHTPWEWHQAIVDHARKYNLILFSSPFDKTSVDFLEKLSVPCYKIASFENGDLPLLRRVARTGKPVLLSTGMASIADLHEAVTTLRDNGCRDIILLKCTSTYPANTNDSHLNTIPHLRQLFNCEVGLSDHTQGIGAAIAAVALGATVVEKHFTLSRADGGVDAEFSLEPEELRSLVTEIRNAWKALGTIHYGVLNNEKSSTRFRRSIYVVNDINAGEILTENNIRIIRPGFGLEPKYIDQVIGRRAAQKLPCGTALKWHHLV